MCLRRDSVCTESSKDWPSEQCHSVLAFGPPGSFKTHGLIIPPIREWQGNLTTPIKPDILRATCPDSMAA
jgi:hypothetical protein